VPQRRRSLAPSSGFGSVACCRAHAGQNHRCVDICIGVLEFRVANDPDH
jgi:hypothetical protein